MGTHQNGGPCRMWKRCWRLCRRRSLRRGRSARKPRATGTRLVPHTAQKFTQVIAGKYVIFSRGEVTRANNALTRRFKPIIIVVKCNKEMKSWRDCRKMTKLWTLEQSLRLWVSKTTVSGQYPAMAVMGAATRQRVQDYVKEHNYTPSVMARGLAMRCSYNISLVISKQFSDFEMPFCARRCVRSIRWRRIAITMCC